MGTRLTPSPGLGSGPSRRINIKQVFRAAQGLLLAGVLSGLAAIYIGSGDPQNLIFARLFLSGGAGMAGLALALAARARPDLPRHHTAVTAALLVITAGLVGLTGGATSEWASVPIAVAILTAPFTHRTWLVSALAAICLAAPLAYQFTWTYAAFTALGWGVIAVGTAIALRVARELIRTKLEARELQALGKTSQITADLDLDATMTGTLEAVRELFAPDAVILYLIDSDGDDQQVLRPSHVHFEPSQYTPSEAAAVGEAITPVGRGLVGKAALNGIPCLIPDASKEPGAIRLPGARPRSVTYILVPLLFDSELLGLLRISRDGAKQYVSEDLTLATILANHAAVAIANSRLYAKIRAAEAVARDAEARYSRLTRHAGEVIFELDLETHTVTYINEAMEHLLGYSLSQLQSASHNLHQIADAAANEQMISMVRAFEGGSEVIRDAQLSWRAHDGRTVTVLHTVIPLRDQAGRLIGIESIGRDVTEERRLESEVRLLTYYDQLTGVFNRAYFERELARLNSAQHLPLTVIMGDINGLKLANDAFGHRTGDQLLINSARVLESVLRRADVICRWGGDEFAMLLPHLDQGAAGEVMIRIRAALATEAPDPIPLSIALGMATKDETCQDIATILKEAEDRMYRNKLLESRSTHSAIVASLEKTLWEKTNESEAHARRLQAMVSLLGRELGLEEDQLTDLALLAILHDIGKVGIPHAVLANPGHLSPDEWEIIKRHPEIGYRIASACPNLAPIAGLILSHHERWDGTGYPRRLAANEIPLAARILAVADAFDVMTGGRPYRAAISADAALAELSRCAGTQFDPAVVEAFCRSRQSRLNGKGVK